MVNPDDIKQAVRQIAERFRPERVVLFGSYAYGEPTDDSDVDLFIVVRGRNVHNRSIRICQAIDFPFPVDLVVRSVDEVKRRIGWGDSFLIEIEKKGKVLYESADARMGAKSRGRLLHRAAGNSRSKVAKLR